MHQAQFLMGKVVGFLSAVDQVMAAIACYGCLGVVRLTSGTARPRQPVMRQYTGFRVAVAVPGYPHGTFAATRRFA